ncbi:MAG: DUF4294 domain-containing protein [Bacteroidales bacterium]|nr:DUF4294 domain-containing protein [Bacteroidales bacterium]
MKYIVLFLIVLFAVGPLQAQQGHVLGYKLEQGDTVYQITLKPVYVFPQPVYKNEKAKREYQRLVHNFRKVYPYALLAKQRLDRIDAEVVAISSKKEREEFIKRKEKELFKEFEKPLKKLTFSQGKLLMRLIDREVGQTSYYIIKDIKGGFTAFFWQGIAQLFGANLKKPYDKYGEDKPVEAMVKMYHEGSFEHYYYRVMGYY